jgi:transposase-like protein
MARAYPQEVRDDVVAVARKREAPISQIAKDFGISEATLHNWLKRADIEEGVRPGVKQLESERERAQRRRIKTLEQENEILRRAAAYFAKQLPPK